MERHCVAALITGLVTIWPVMRPVNSSLVWQQPVELVFCAAALLPPRCEPAMAGRNCLPRHGAEDSGAVNLRLIGVESAEKAPIEAFPLAQLPIAMGTCSRCISELHAYGG